MTTNINATTTSGLTFTADQSGVLVLQSADITALTVSGANVSIAGNVTSGNILTAGLLSATGNVTGGNIRTAGQVSATGNVTGGNVLATGVLRSTLTSMANAVSNATAITVNTATPTTIASCTLTTTGKNVFIVSTGDANPNQTGGWNFVALYRDSTQVGKIIINENAGGSSKNCPFAVCFIDTPSAGTYTYTTKAYQGSGSFTYGETGDIQAPTIFAVEIL